MFDGNTPEDTYRAVLRGIEDGDPAILDAHPAPGLSAGGGYTEADLARDLGLDGEDQLPPDAATAYLDAAARPSGTRPSASPASTWPGPGCPARGNREGASR